MVKVGYTICMCHIGFCIVLIGIFKQSANVIDEHTDIKVGTHQPSNKCMTAVLRTFWAARLLGRRDNYETSESVRPAP